MDNDILDTENLRFSFNPSMDIFGETLDFMDESTNMDDVFGGDPGVFLPNREGRTEFLPPEPERVPVIEHAVKQNTGEYASRPAEERTRELFKYMNPHRHVLRGILEAAREPRETADLTRVIDGLRAHKFSVYSPTNLCTMLEMAGALACINEDGSEYRASELEPRVLVIDGEEYWEPVRAPKRFWVITEAGIAQLADDDSSAQIEALLEREHEFEHLYRRILVLVSREGGATMSALSEAIDDDPSICQPRRRFFVQHFIEALEHVQAVSWTGNSWEITGSGRAVLDGPLAGVMDDRIPEPGGSSLPRLRTETQGISW